MKIRPLRYQISTLRQLPTCLSNNSRFLHIQVDDFVHNRTLTGTRISVVHDEFGVLFCTIMNGSGDLITDVGDDKLSDYAMWNLSTGELFRQLAKFGFDITYSPGPDISSKQLEYLMSIRNLGYDKIRILHVWHVDKFGKQLFDTKIVGFKSDKVGDWLNSSYSPSSNSYFEAIDRGWCFNLSAQDKSNKFTWDWLNNAVINIDDIIYDFTTDDTQKDNTKPATIRLRSIPDEGLKFNN